VDIDSAINSPVVGCVFPRLLAGCEKTQNAVILSEAKNLSFFVLLNLNRREILRFAQNDTTSHFFRSLLEDPRYAPLRNGEMKLALPDAH
jgi:hypothetical protein